MRKNAILILILMNWIGFSCTIPSPTTTQSNRIMMNKKEVFKPTYKDSDLVASYSTSPCLGECPVFKVEIYGNGKIKYRGNSYVTKIGSYETQTSKEKIDLLLQKAVEINYVEKAQKQMQELKPHVHDGYSIIMNILLNGMTREITCGGGQKCSKEILDFQEFFYKLFEEEIKGL